jgi:hypothetical protein
VTTADDYLTKLTEGYEWIAVAAHSAPWRHIFYSVPELYDGYEGMVNQKDIKAIDPHCFFYAIAGCNAGRFTEPSGCIAASYIFTQTYGLACFASTYYSGGPIVDTAMIQALAEGKNLGDAFLESDFSGDSTLTLFGDPTLKPSFNPGWFSIADLNGDGVVNILDIVIVSSAFGATKESANWNPVADVNGDNKIDITDIFAVANEFGKKN